MEEERERRKRPLMLMPLPSWRRRWPEEPLGSDVARERREDGEGAAAG